jgi:hypothetical protein
MKNMRHFGAVVLLSCVSLQLHARPYATGLTNESGTITFRLNESADSVLVVSGGGATTNDLGALAAGLHTFPLGVSSPFEVHVSKTSPPGFITPISPNRSAVLQIGEDSLLTRFNQPRGVAVNTDPASPYFGRVYVANGAAAASPFPRAVGDGIFVLNPDLTDALGQGDAPLTGGLDFGTGGTVSPYRLTIGPDGSLYIADWSDTTGSLYLTDANVGAGSGTNILGGPVGSPFPVTTTRIHGSIAAAVVEGSVATGDLRAYVIDEDMQNDRTSTAQTMRNSLWRHDIGGTLPPPADVLPTLLRQGGSDWIAFASQTMDLDRGTNGYFYVFDNRSVGSDRSGLTVLGTNGSDLLFSSLPASRAFTGNATENDLLRATGGGAVSPNGDYVALINIETNGLTVVPLIDGVPDITNRLVFHGMGVAAPQGRDVAFDRAGNLYAVSQGAGLLRAFSPGGTSTTITGSDGTFRMVLPASVSVLPQDLQGSEEGADSLSFRISRAGSTTEALMVNYTLSGTASNGLDYVSPQQLTVEIPAGQSEVVIIVTPIDDAEPELTETVILTLGVSQDYNLGAPISATGTISDNEPVVSVQIEDSQGYEDGADTLSFRISRTGSSTAEALTVNYSLSGTASNGLDYVSPQQLTVEIPAGQSEVVIIVTPIDDAEPELTETVILTLGVSQDYSLGAPINATGTISDNEAPVLLRIRPLDTNAYERFPSDTLGFTITRLGNTNTSQFVLFDFTGAATLDVDYSRMLGDAAFLITEGTVTTNYFLQPIDDFQFEGDETLTISLVPNDYQVESPGGVSARIREDDYAPETPVFTENFNVDTASNNWAVMFWASNNIPDYSVDWAFDYSTLGIPAAPGSAGADTRGVRVTVNKTEPTGGGAAAVNLYPTNRTFSGDYALRFDLYLQYNTPATTEHALAGINHSGLLTNRVNRSDVPGNSARGADGIWVAIENDGSANREWGAYTSTNAGSQPHLITNRTAAAVASLVTSPPYSVAGSPGNNISTANKAWADVELSQVGDTVTLRVNKNLIYRITNTFGFNSGTIMIGHNDQFDSVGSTDTFAIFDNVRVISLGSPTPPEITDITVSGGNVIIDFETSSGGQPSEFRIESTPTLTPPNWAQESAATIAPNGNGFRATLPASGDMRFYRVRR